MQFESWKKLASVILVQGPQSWLHVRITGKLLKIHPIGGGGPSRARGHGDPLKQRLCRAGPDHGTFSSPQGASEMPCGKEGVQSNSLVSALRREVRCSRVRLLHLLPLLGVRATSQHRGARPRSHRNCCSGGKQVFGNCSPGGPMRSGRHIRNKKHF